jgi:hypothetical protein
VTGYDLIRLILNKISFEVDPRGRVIGALSYVGCELCSIMFYHFSDIFEEEKALATFENKCC